MNSKHFAMIAAGILMFAMIVSGVSALTLSVSSSSLNFLGNGSSQKVSVSSSSGENFNITSYNIADNPADLNENLLFEVTNSSALNNVSRANFTITQNPTFNLDSLNYGKTTSTLLFTAVNSTTGSKANKTLTINYFKSFCQYGDVNDSNLQLSVSVTNDGNLASGDSTTWNPLDTIEVEVTVYNNNNFDLNNMMLELGLIDPNGNNVANKLDWISSDNNIVSLDTISSEDSVTYTFKFRVDPKLISNPGTGNYKLMIKAYPKNNEGGMCIDYSNDFDNPLEFVGSNGYASQVTIESQDSSHAVVVDMNSIPSVTSTSCGQQVSFNPIIYNIGGNSNSYSKKQIMVQMYSPLGGINQNETIYGDLNSGDSTQLLTPFTFKIPLNADEKQYPVYFTIYYGYTSNSNSGYYFDHYQYLSSDNFVSYLTVKGGCVYATPATTQVSAQLQQGGKAGEPLIIQATVTNTGNKTVSYNFGLEGYTSWAALSSITPQNITLSPGQSQNVLLNLNVNSDASGDKQFYLDIYSNGYLITQQPLTKTITPQFSLSSITGGVINGSNAGLWVFNIVLILAIIIILVVVLRRRGRKA